MTILQKIQWLKGERLIGRFRCIDENENNDLSTFLNQIEISLKKKSKPRHSKSFESNYKSFISHFNYLKGQETGTKGKFQGDEKSKRQFRVLYKQHKSIDIVKAINAMFRDQYHIDTGFKYATPEFITRQDKFARFLEQS